MRTRSLPGPRPRRRVGALGTAPRTGGLGVLALAATLVLAGCSAAGDNADPKASASASPSSASPSSSDAGSDASPSASSTASAAASGASLASKNFTVTTTYAQLPARMHFEIVSLERRDDLLQLVAHLTNTSAERSKDMRWQVASRFDSAITREDLQSYNGTFAGAVLTDVAGKKRYLVAADSAKDCVCTSDLSATFVGAGQTVELVATYAAPPASTTKLDVEVPTLGLFRDVPVS
jgi:hypothetical protein